MSKQKPHWTQTPEGREKMSRVMKAWHGTAKRTKKRPALEAVNGHAAPAPLEVHVDHPGPTIDVHPTNRRVLKTTIQRWQVEGAKADLARLRAECQAIEMFIKAAERK